MNSPPASSATATSSRLLSLDVYRGLVMFCLFASGFGLSKVANNFPDSEPLQWVKFHVTHPSWSSQFWGVGFSLWDMIQPAFMFMVGVSMPYSYSRREQLGDGYGARLRHAWTRALVLVLLGVGLASMGKPQTNWMFTNVLSQIGLGYGFLFFLLGAGRRIQLLAGGVILAGYWLLMICLPSGLEGDLAAHFENGASFPQEFDRWLLNLFPREQPLTQHDYATLNFVPAAVTMLIGIMCGELIRSELTDAEKSKRLWIGGCVCLIFAVLWSPLCPIVKKLWTPSWTLFSGAYVVWLLAFLYWLIDVKGWRHGWTWFFSIVGMNSIAAYFMGQLLKPWTRRLLKTHLPDEWFAGDWGPLWEAIGVAAFFWLVLWWMHRNRLFIRI